jgi:hypothetical protein
VRHPLTSLQYGLLQDGGVGDVLSDAGLPLGGAGGVDAGAERVDGDGDGDGHVDDIELVDGFHAEVGEGEDAGGVDGLLRNLRCLCENTYSVDLVRIPITSVGFFAIA